MPKSDAPKSINLARVGDSLAVRRPAEYLTHLADQLAVHGDAVVHRIFRVLTDPKTTDRTFLDYLKELHKLMCAREIMATFLALRNQGRPGADDDPEVIARRKRWTEVMERYPEAASAIDAEFTVKDLPPPRRGA